jgi:hypothetical protein
MLKSNKQMSDVNRRKVERKFLFETETKPKNKANQKNTRKSIKRKKKGYQRQPQL